MDQKSNQLTKSAGHTSSTTPTATDESMEKYEDGFDQSLSDVRESAEISADASHDTEQIKAEIEETRISMGETIDAIQDRLSFANISEQVSEQVNNAIETAKDSVYEATIGKAVNFMKNTGNELSHTSVVKTVKDNPIPFALIGIGSGLLIYNSFANKSTRRNASSYIPVADRSHEPTAGLYQTAAAKVSGAAETVSSSAGTAIDGVANAASSAYSGARDVAANAYEKAGDIGHAAHEKYDYYVQEKPLAIGAVALAVGAAVGFAIPSTRYEGKLMGEAKTNLLNKAEQTATGLVDKAKQVASDAGREITDEIKMAADSAKSH